MSDQQRPVGPYVFTEYRDPTAASHPYDPCYPEVADHLISLMAGVLPGLVVEHIGSTAVPECSGKGVVDMMCIYPPGDLDAVQVAVESLGYQAFRSADPFPQERPVYIGSVDWQGARFRTHMHLIPEGWPEIETQRTFRDRLRADPDLVKAYCALKEAVLAAGAGDNVAYNAGKEAFIKDVIEGRR